MVKPGPPLPKPPTLISAGMVLLAALGTVENAGMTLETRATRTSADAVIALMHSSETPQRATDSHRPAGDVKYRGFEPWRKVRSVAPKHTWKSHMRGNSL